MYRGFFLSLFAFSGCFGDLEWYPHPCGNGDPVVLACDGEADVVWAEPTTDLCEDLDASSGTLCEVNGAECVLVAGYSCASNPGPSASETRLTCRNNPFPDQECPE